MTLAANSLLEPDQLKLEVSLAARVIALEAHNVALKAQQVAQSEQIKFVAKASRNHIGTLTAASVALVANILFSTLSNPVDYAAVVAAGKGHAINPLIADEMVLKGYPVQGRISSEFGMRIDPLYQTEENHPGIDIAAPEGTPIKATGYGTLIFMGVNGGYGNSIIIQHDHGLQTLVGHMSKFADNMYLGKSINEGDVIGYVGSTGKSTGNHTHYEVRQTAVSLDDADVSKSALHDAYKWLLEQETIVGTDIGVRLREIVDFNTDHFIALPNGLQMIGLTPAQTQQYLQTLLATESTFNFNVVNPQGYMGAGQFGAAALVAVGLVDKAKFLAARRNGTLRGRDGWIGQKEWLQDNGNWLISGGANTFITNRDVQLTAIVRLANLNLQEGYRTGALHSTDSAKKHAGYAKAAHLVGSGRATLWYKYGIDSDDANKTRASKYARDGENAID